MPGQFLVASPPFDSTRWLGCPVRNLSCQMTTELARTRLQCNRPTRHLSLFPEEIRQAQLRHLRTVYRVRPGVVPGSTAPPRSSAAENIPNLKVTNLTVGRTLQTALPEYPTHCRGYTSQLHPAFSKRLERRRLPVTTLIVAGLSIAESFR